MADVQVGEPAVVGDRFGQPTPGLVAMTDRRRWPLGVYGLVLSAAGLAAPPGGSTYQMWLATRSRTWSAGTFAPDERGAVTHAMPPGSLPAPGTATLLVTVEPEGGSAAPAGDVVLARPRPPAPTPPEAAQ